MIHTLADEFTTEIATLCATAITDQQWRDFLTAHVPLTHPDGQPLHGRALTGAHTKHATLTRLYRNDPRVAPWTGTAHGVLQAVNTYEHHENTVRRGDRAERNQLRTIHGHFATLDRTTWTTLNYILTTS